MPEVPKAQGKSDSQSGRDGKGQAMTKPTPGPYTIYTANTPDGKHDGYVVMSDTDNTNIVMASFFTEGDGEKALANARAFIDGIAAMEVIAKIREQVGLWCDGVAPDSCMVAIESILDEDKP
jgi:hypothetical protein